VSTRDWKAKRRFDGRVYTFYYDSASKKAVEGRKAELRKDGFRVRIVPRDGLYGLYGISPGLLKNYSRLKKKK
jgi:hypothetical protein